MRKFPVLILTLLLPAVMTVAGAHAGGEGSLTAKVYEIGGDRKAPPKYRYERVEKREGDRAEGTATFSDAETGLPVAVEKIILDQGNLVSYHVERKAVNEAGSVEIKGDKAVLTCKRGDKTDTAEIAMTENFVVGPLMLYYVKKHWQELMDGKEVPVRLAVVDRLDTYGFKFFKMAEETRDGKAVVKLKMKPSSFILAALVDPVFLTVERDSFRLLEVSGRTLVKRQIAGEWQDLDADMVFDSWGGTGGSPQRATASAN